MRFIALGLAAAMLATLSPVMAFAADKAKPPVDDPKLHVQAMKEAPPLVTQAGLPCTLTDAKVLGVGKPKDDKGKEVQTTYYELVCSEGLGYVLIAPQGGTPTGFDCLALTANKPKAGEADKGQLYCRLPANADPVKGLQPVAAKAGLACTVDQARWMGANPEQKFDQYEISCSEGRAYVLQVPAGGSTHALTPIDCLTLDSGVCQYFTKEKLAGLMSRLAGPANRPCQVTNARWMGTAANTHHSYYELACSDEKAGYVLELDPQDKFVSSLDCARASAIGTGCTLTSAAAAQTAELATYARLSKEIGYGCQVQSYRSLGLEQKTGRELVELACSDHPDGAFALLPVDKGQIGEYFNCVRAASRGAKCALTTETAAYSRISAQISGKGKSCQVSNARSVGVAASGDDYVEVACSGAPGLMVEYATGPETVKSVLSCAEAKGVGGGCTLK